MLVFRAGSDQVTPWDAKNHQYYVGWLETEISINVKKGARGGGRYD